jgi:hypothetical protein
MESLHTLEEDILRKMARRKVKFFDEENVYLASVTPDLLPGSFDEEHFASLKM